MIDFAVLAAFSTTNERLKQVFSSVASTDKGPVKGESKDEKKARIDRERQNARDVEVRARLEREIQAHTEQGIVFSLSHWRKYATVDLAWDSSIISGMSLPLRMYAQGKINVERAAKLLSSCDGGDSYVKKDDKGTPVEIDVPRFVETQINLVRSIIGRRHGAQKNKYNQLWPYYKYEARSTGLPAKCRADVLSQRVDMMTDQFGYRHHDADVMRDGLLYGHSVDFVRQPWEIEKQYERKDNTQPATKDNVQDVITKEGVGFYNPHPSRLFWNLNKPLSAVNVDDIDYLGFWDVVPFGDIDDNPYYFNKTSIGWTSKYWGADGIFSRYGDYFTHYMYSLVPPQTGELNIAGANDRKIIAGTYTSQKRDATVFTANYFRKLVPKDYGIGEYPWPVWVRFVAASNGTVIFAELMPSTPAAVLSINESDGRAVNVSMAMDLFAYQDQMTNLVTHLMLLCQMEAFKAITINKDLVDAEDIKRIRAIMKGINWFADPLIVEHSLLKLEELGIKPQQVISIVSANQSASIASLFDAMIKLVTLVEKLMALSPNEQGQPAPREISATEVNEIANTTSSVYSSISEDIDEYRAAKKRIIYESLVACGKGQIVCPVKDRYTTKTILAAGFTPKQGEDDGTASPGAARRMTVTGSTRSLIHDYVFTSRDGAERPVNTQSANTIVQMVQFLMGNMVVAQALGKERIYMLVNEAVRMSGAGVDINLELKEGEDDSFGQDDMAQIKQTLQQLTQSLQQLAQHTQKNAEDLASQENVNNEQQQALKGLVTLSEQVHTTAKHVDELQQKHSDINKRLIETISYKDAPDSIRRQLESQAGFRPAFGEESPAEKIAKMKTKPAAKAA